MHDPKIRSSYELLNLLCDDRYEMVAPNFKLQLVNTLESKTKDKDELLGIKEQALLRYPEKPSVVEIDRALLITFQERVGRRIINEERELWRMIDEDNEESKNNDGNV